MAGVLDDERIHEFIGGSPATVEELRDRYTRMVAGSGRPDERWLNWVVRRRDDGRALGTVQATLTCGDDDRWRGEVAWVIGPAAQGRGYAGEAATALVTWLRSEGVAPVSANIHPDHHASAAVARRAGLVPTDDQVDGETVWVVQTP